MGKYLPVFATLFLLIVTTTIPTSILVASSIGSSLDTFTSTKTILEENMDCRQQDSLVLAELYLATNANGWTNPWDLSQPMDTWYGVVLNEEGCVEVLDLDGYTSADCHRCGGGNNLTDTIPFSIWSLVHLKTLSFSFNFSTILDSLPYDIDKISELEVLSLNQLGVEGHIPSSIGNLSNLYHILLATNDLVGDIPTSMSSLTNLTYLNLSSNELTNLPDLSNSLGLRNLLLNGNPLGGTIPNWLGLLTNLEYIDWSNCELEGTIPAFWDGFNNLRLLSLTNNQLTGSIPSNLGATSMRYLRLSNNKLNELIPNFAGASPRLRDLDVRNNQLTFEDLLLNFNVNETLINANATYELDKYDYQPQQQVGAQTSLNFIAGQDYIIDLNIDDTVTTNVYKWFKNGILFQTNTGNNILALDNVTRADLGTYVCEITNPNIPDLILESHPYRLFVIDPDCRMKDSLVLVDLYNATDGANWRNIWDLNQPMTTWYGVQLNVDNCVEVVDLDGILHTNCESCYFGNNNLRGTLPANFWNLKNLTRLSFGGNSRLNISLTSTIGNLTELKVLNLYFVNLSGSTIPTEIGDLQQLTTLILENNQLTGTIPTELGNLIQLKKLRIVVNQLTGAIPNSFSNLTNLEDLDLRNNQLNELPNDLSNLTKLVHLNLSFNPFNTNLPNWLGELNEIVQLELMNNGWMGTIPPSMGNLNKLFSLYMENNQLTGAFPTFLSTIPSLRTLDIAENNFDGVIPDFSTTAIILRDLEIQNNQFTFEDIVPHFTANKNIIATNSTNTSYTYDYQPQAKAGTATIESVIVGANYTFDLGIDDTVTTNTYTWFKDGELFQTINGDNTLTFNNVTVENLGTYTCQITNSIATDLTLESYPYTLRLMDTECRMQDSLVLVDLYNVTGGASWTNTWDLNQPMSTWFGVSTNIDGCVTSLNLSHNNLIGTPTNTLWNLDNLSGLYLNGNEQLSGTLPPTINNLTNLIYLNLNDANFSGAIPSEIGTILTLEYINFSENSFNGAIPSSMNNLLNLETLYLGENQFSSITDLGALTALSILSLRDNPFSSPLPAWIGNLTKLTNLNLGNNRWTGAVPSTFSNLSNLQVLDLSNNQLTGDLPANFNQLNNISSLGLFNNQLTGSITSVIGNMDNLFFANLNRNQFTGIIPNLTNISPNLGFIYFGFNGLTFEDILPNLTANSSHVQSNHSNGQFGYSDQARIGVTTTFVYNLGDSYTFDLEIDEAVSDNVYKWYKDGTLIQTITGNNKLILNNVTTADLGTYTCQVTNPGAPSLTLLSFSYSLVESIPTNDNVCDAQILTIGTSRMGSFVGASNELNEPVVEGEDCEDGWCNAELHGSVWYAFTAPTDPSVSIRVSGIGSGSLDSKIALYEGIDCSASNPFENAMLIQATDDILGEYQIGSFIRLACLNAGSLYFIQVEQYEPEQIDFEIIVEQLESCELPCNLSLLSSSITAMTCPDSNDAIILNSFDIPLGQPFMYDLYKDNNLVESRPSRLYSANFFNQSAGSYTVTARSLDSASCSLTIGPFEVVNAIDTIPPTTNCVNASVNVAYVHSAHGNPFHLDSYNREMDTIFQDNWQELIYELVNPQLLFSDAYNFIYLEGNNFNYYDLDTLMSANRQLIEDWVALGNSLFINADPIIVANYNIGFNGVLLTNLVNSTSATAVDPNHPIFLGPITPTTTTLTGEGALGEGLLANAIVGPYSIDATPLLEAPNGDDLLVEVAWGNGTIFFGTMTASAFHQPSIEAFNLKANMLAYLAGKAIPAVNTPISLALDENQTATLTPALIDMGSFDKCTLTDLQVNKTTFDCFDVGLQPLTLITTDASGNNGTCTTSIMVTAPNDYCADLIGECLNERTMNSTMEGGIYPAATTFTATGMIENDKKVVFKAGTSITLLPGFHAQAGSNFTAMIEDCTPATLQEEVTERSQPFLTNALLQPKELQLKAYPNPFNITTTVDYYLPTASQTQLQLMDFMGKKVQLVQPLQESAAGWHQVQLNATDLPTGTYFLVLENEGQIKTRQLILVK